jgi:hypothetical protein
MRSVIIGVLGSVWVLGAVGEAMADSVQWSGNGHSYEVVSVPGGITWNDANAAATSAGRYLATITSQAENDFVFALIDSSAYWQRSDWNTYHWNLGPWLGGFQSPPTSQPAANWNWVTAEAWGYTNWASGVPDDSFGDQDKLQFVSWDPTTRSPKWNDEFNVPNGGVLPIAYVVESVPEPSTFALLGVAAIGLLVCVWRRWEKAL